MDIARAVLAKSRRGVSTVARTIGIARSSLTAKPKIGKRGRKALPDEQLVGEIRAVIDEQGSYGYRRAWATIRRRRRERDEAGPNHKRVYRVMKAHQLLLARSTGADVDDRRHDGTISVEEKQSALVF